MSLLKVKISSRSQKSSDGTSSTPVYEGTVSVPGLRPTKLVRKSDGSTTFSNRSAVTTAAKTLSRSLGFSDVDFGEEASQTKKAAKKTAMKRRA